jgi:hypothetical protein
MSINLWVSIGVAMIAGLFAAIIAPLITARLARTNWRRCAEGPWYRYRSALVNQLTSSTSSGTQTAHSEIG